MPSTTNSLLAGARAALISDPLRAAVLLEEAVVRLRAHHEPVDPAELKALAQLARNGQAFWRGWGRLLGLEPGYTATGEPETASTPTGPAPAILVKG